MSLRLLLPESFPARFSQIHLGAWYACIMVDEFKKLESDFKATQIRFKKARTLEEKRELLELSWKIIQQARERIAEFRAQISTAKESHELRRS